MAYGVTPFDPTKQQNVPSVKPFQPQPISGPPSTGTIGPQVSYAPTTVSGPPTTQTIGPARWNPDASYQERLAHFASNPNDARSEILAVKDIYNKEAPTATADRLGSVHSWADQVRSAAGILNDDVIYGNAPDPQKVADPLAKPIASPPAAQSKDYTAIMDSVRNNYMRDLQDKTSSIEQQLQQAIAASNLAVNQNNAQLQERVKQLQDMKAQNDDDILQFNNRFGGAYSGGTAYQRGVNADASTRAVSGATRDVDMRNQDIWGKNALLAQQAADNIMQLKNAAPDKIRELIRQAVNDERSFGLQEGQLTGDYNGQRTLAGQQFDQGVSVDNRNFNYQTGRDNILDNRWKQTFDYQQSRDTVGDSQWQKTFDHTASQDFFKNEIDKMLANNTITKTQADIMLGQIQASISQQNANTNADQLAWQKETGASESQWKSVQQGLDIFKSTGEMPAYMKDFGINVDGLNNKATKDKVSNLLNMLMSGKQQPQDLLKIINAEEAAGVSTKDEADQLKRTIYQYDPSLDPAKTNAKEPSFLSKISKGLTNPSTANTDFAGRLGEMYNMLMGK